MTARAPARIRGARPTEGVTTIQSRFKRRLAIGTVAVAAAAFAGGAYASTQDPAAGSRQAFLNDVAKRLHVTPAQLNSALTGAALDELSAAVKEGRITQAQANVIKQRIEKAGASGQTPLGPGAWRVGPGPALPLKGAPGRAFFGGHLVIHAGIDAAAKYLGLTDVQLRKQLEAGKSLAQIGKAQGKSTTGLEQTLTAAVKLRLDKAVAHKRITSAQEQKIMTRLSAGIKDLINASPPAKGQLPRLGHRAFGYHAFGGRFAPTGRFGVPPAAKGGPAAFPTAPSPSGPIAQNTGG
jgi:hypothetical protein